MKMTTRGRYGLRAMLELARCHGQPPLLMDTLAKRERLSRKYLHALLAVLKSAGLVRSSRGTGGGFQLSRSPAEIRLSQILHAVEGPLSLVDCVAQPSKCPRSKNCTARRVWHDLSSAIETLLDSVTLNDLIAMESEPSSRGRCRPVASLAVSRCPSKSCKVSRCSDSGSHGRTQRSKSRPRSRNSKTRREQRS